MNQFEAEVEEKELRQMAIHEASHVVVARHVGALFATASLWENDGWEERGEVRWGAHCQYYFGSAGRSASVRHLIGMAGCIGELIYHNQKEGDRVRPYDYVAAAMAGGRVSDSDLAGMGNDWTLEDVDRVVEILTFRWEEVLRHARWLTAQCR